MRIWYWTGKHTDRAKECFLHFTTNVKYNNSKFKCTKLMKINHNNWKLSVSNRVREVSTLKSIYDQEKYIKLVFTNDTDILFKYNLNTTYGQERSFWKPNLILNTDNNKITFLLIRKHSGNWIYNIRNKNMNTHVLNVTSAL